ncbi:NEL-type E3 ubiquitin ligase domain-containing protein [Pseudomonas sp. AM14(2022)]|uniref:NEL-type E3 ubiquitin ligase domain-containing protein n=1 Tax=Pseudomonas sp. AM14(2022) TaxID=2983371 RepID=UPI002E81A63C|nr:NEL-type E3 ubiquitin ligase domain-containing protein [Pseudomonas sp. AM14(2022)]
MPTLSPQGQPPRTAHLVSPDVSVHYQTIEKAIPAWLRASSAKRVNELQLHRLKLPAWYQEVSDAEHLRLQQQMENAWKAQNQVDKALSSLQDVYAFAKPLLQQALRQRFGVEDDVENTWLRLYAPVNSAWWAHDFAGATTSRTVSLLDAALHNFAWDEVFSPDSEFITRPDANGHFTVRPLKHKLSIEQFKSLCRELNIGARYEQHLNEFLGSGNRVARQVLQYRVIFSQKSTLSVCAQLALAKKDIDRDAYEVIQGMLDDRRNLRWRGRAINYYNLAMMDTALTGITLIAPDVDTANAPVPVIAYVPHDPEHPLKQYPSALDFMAELTRQLRDRDAAGSYQRFFSQFVNHQQRGHFFAGLNARLSNVKWHAVPPGTNLPSWRETPVDHPDLRFRLTKVQDDRDTRYTGSLWTYFYQQKLNKIFNDAREIAISTEYADRMARWAWWDNLGKILSDIFNVALLVVTPLVPGLGELMLAYTTYQLLDGVFEGIVDMAEGHLAEAGEQAIGVLQSIVQLGAFAAGASLGRVARVKLSSFVEGLKPVQLADGQTRLWNPDLAPYRLPEQTLSSPARPDAYGVHTLGDKQLLRLDQHLFEVTKDPVSGKHRLRHPRRPRAYAPTLAHNADGAWVCETENPRLWDGRKLLRRIGHRTDGFSDAQLEHMRLLTGTDEDMLRRMHVDNTPPPPLLSDTLDRLGPARPVQPDAPLSPAASQVMVDCPQLTPVLAERVVSHARPLEQQQATTQRRLPLRLRTTAREVQFELQSVRAAQGLQQEALSNIDSERLILGALRHYSDTFGALRIEIREGTFDGELRCEAGAAVAERIRVLVRVAADRYQVRDGANLPIHPASGLYEAILQAINHDGRSALGYRTDDIEPFKQWIIARTQAPSERRTLLASPPIRPIAEYNTLFLVRGPGLSRNAATLEQRIQDLHPHFSPSEVEAFANALTERGEPLKAIEEHENELDELRVIVHRWRYQQPQTWGPGSQGFRDGGGLHIYESLLDCFERRNAHLGNRADPSAYALDLSRELLSTNLETWWAKRPPLKKFLDKVTLLNLDNARFSPDANGLLKDFPNVVELSAKYCELTRLPDRIGTTMRRLERLRLNNNHIVLDRAAVERLGNLTYLEVLRMDDNPLGLSPDLSRMPRLKVVALKNTGLTTWPDGILAKPRPRGLLLDLRGNPLTVIPDVPSGSDGQWLVARTRLDVAALSDLNQLRYQDSRRSMALPPEPIMPVAIPGTSIISNYGADYWSDVPGWGIDRETPWTELVEDPMAAPFMATLLSVREFADFRAGGAAREQLMQRVWRMLDAVHVDSRLREKLFTMVVAPVDCADAGAQLFNHMGVNVLAYEAHAYSVEPKELELKLVTLAKGAARLEQVNEIARADVASRGGNPDDVEVYLAYQTGLAKRLGLPWQSEGMLYRPVSGVTDAMIDQAYDTVLALGEGDGLVNQMLELDFWKEYLSERYPVRLESNKRLFQHRYEALESLREIQLQWVQSTVAEERAALREQLKTLMNDLPAPATVVFNEEPISDTLFERLLVDLADDEKELARRLTREALTRAGL